jgi:hypothetical protein
VYEDFFSYSSGVYKHISGDVVGGHVVLVVGYDDPGQYFIVKNSWGDWGERGYFRIDYSEVLSTVGFGGYSGAFSSKNDGECGNADGHTFVGADTSWGSYTICNSGTANPASPSFPLVGSSARWNCDGTNGGTTASCASERKVVALALTASPTLITSGEAVTLTWKPVNANSCWFEGPGGLSNLFDEEADVANGFSGWAISTNGIHTAKVYPNATATYSMECWNNDGASSGKKNMAITVFPMPTLDLTASSTEIVQGGTSSITWRPVNADSCYGWGPDGTFTKGVSSTGGTVRVSPTVTSEYTVNCWNRAGVEAGSKTVTVTVASPICKSITPSPSTIIQGQSATLSWNQGGEYMDCWNMTGDGIPGAVDGTGTISVYLNPTSAGVKKYSIGYCEDENGDYLGCYNATLNVINPPPPTLTFAASPTKISLGTPATLTWKTANATSCWFDGPGGFSNLSNGDADFANGNSGWAVSSDGTHTAKVYPTTTTTYYMECWNNAGVGAGYKTATITVAAMPCNISMMIFSKSVVAINEATSLSWLSSNTSGTCSMSGSLVKSGLSPNGSVNNIYKSAAGSYPYTLTCHNALNQSCSKTASLTVSATTTTTTSTSTTRQWPTWFEATM